MKITDETVQQFEGDQKDYGTQTAIYNLLWRNAADQMTDIGVTSIKTKIPAGNRGVFATARTMEELL